MQQRQIEAGFAEALDAAGVRDAGLLVAVSGGRDSCVLLELFARSALARGLRLRVGHVNHGLRGAASDADEAHVRALAGRHGLVFATRRVDPERDRADVSSRLRPSPEEAARNRRREALAALAAEHDCRWIATAHHQGDQAESVLLRLLRGAGPDALAGMDPVSADGRWLKPLLGVAPGAIEAWAAAAGLVWREDASNRDPRHARNRLRHAWLPGLADAFNPQLLRTLAHLAEVQRRDRDWIATIVHQTAEEWIEIGPDGARLRIEGWDRLPDALAFRLVRHALVEVGLGRELSGTHLERVLDVLRRGRAVGRDKRLQLPSGIQLVRRDACFLLGRDPQPGPQPAGPAERGSEPGHEMPACDDATVHGR